MHEMLLDRDGDAPVPPGYRVVTGEIEFFQHVLDNSAPLFIRGGSLCDWASAFLGARQVPHRDTKSPVRELVALCPGLSASQAKAIYQGISDTFHELPRPLNVPALLTVLYPDRIWFDRPSPSHAAQWLLWVVEQRPDKTVLPLLDAMCGEWQRQADLPESDAYDVRNAAAASTALDQWLRIVDDTPKQFASPFPIPVPSTYKDRAQRNWKEALVRTKGEYLVQLDQRTLLPELKELAVQGAASYFKAHPEDLTKDRLDRLSSHLSFQEQNELRKQLPPPVPSQLPITVGGVLEWFGQQYLPYRFWLVSSPKRSQVADVQDLARQFAEWYLEHYPQALSGGPLGSYLSFARSGSLASSDSHMTTLLIVLDGLHAADAQHLQLQIGRQVPRLTPVSREFAFAPLPTVTAFCKDALFRGVPPARVDDVAPIGEVLSESVSPVERLGSAEPGRVYLWRVLEPDNTYHKRNGSDNLQRDVEAQLNSIAAKIADIVAQVPAEVTLRIVITTDHGRLLARSSRKLAIPDGMKAHGRAAWGSTDKSYPSSGYIIDDDIVYLHAERFGLPCEAALALGEEAFLTSDGKRGSEWYPHGGLYPEEVIIPWIVYARDSERALVKITIQGQGQVTKKGQLEIHAVNLSDIPVSLITLTLDLGRAGKRSIALDWQVSPQSSGINYVEFAPWPSALDAEAASGTIQFRQPNGLMFDVDARLDLRSEDMYSRDDILGGLDL